MPTRPCTCPTSAPPNARFIWSRKWRAAPAAGRKGGRVLVQTFSPDHPAIQAAVRHDYAAFAAGELPIRQMLRYPPFAT